MIQLVTLTSAQTAQFLSATWTDYRESLLGAGFSEVEADLNIERNKLQILDGEMPKPNHHFLDAQHEDVSVGTLWLASRGDESPGQWFVYDIAIRAEYRGQGFGRATMQAAESYVVAREGTSIALNVFGPNTVARSLYESLGFEIQNIGMKKVLA